MTQIPVRYPVILSKEDLREVGEETTLRSSLAYFGIRRFIHTFGTYSLLYPLSIEPCRCLRCRWSPWNRDDEAIEGM